jgi:hypothetical protein
MSRPQRPLSRFARKSDGGFLWGDAIFSKKKERRPNRFIFGRLLSEAKNSPLWIVQVQKKLGYCLTRQYPNLFCINKTNV